MSQIRTGILPLEIETGRYVPFFDKTLKKYRKHTANEPLYKLCRLNAIENEYHFLCVCSVRRKIVFEEVLWSDFLPVCTFTFSIDLSLCAYSRYFSGSSVPPVSLRSHQNQSDFSTSLPVPPSDPLSTAETGAGSSHSTWRHLVSSHPSSLCSGLRVSFLHWATFTVSFLN